VNVSDVGEKVQVEFAGKPEQANVNVPDTVLLALIKIAASADDPCAVATSG
jgi:hypothetical protein